MCASRSSLTEMEEVLFSRDPSAIAPYVEWLDRYFVRSGLIGGPSKIPVLRTWLLNAVTRLIRLNEPIALDLILARAAIRPALPDLLKSILTSCEASIFSLFVHHYGEKEFIVTMRVNLEDLPSDPEIRLIILRLLAKDASPGPWVSALVEADDLGVYRAARLVLGQLPVAYLWHAFACRAAEEGLITLLQELRQDGFDFTKAAPPEALDENLYEEAASGGHVKVLELLWEYRLRPGPASINMAMHAAKAKFMPAFRWLLHRGFADASNGAEALKALAGSAYSDKTVREALSDLKARFQFTYGDVRDALACGFVQSVSWDAGIILASWLEAFPLIGPHLARENPEGLGIKDPALLEIWKEQLGCFRNQVPELFV
jgi:hypothetical protein